LPGRRSCTLGALAILAAFFLVTTASAAGAEEITRETIQLTVERDGTMHVVETIDYDFGPTPRHGIFRDIAVRQHYDNRYDRKFPISNIEVDGSKGTPVQFTESTEGAYHRVKIGDPDTTITGLHRYRITYDVRGAMTRYRDHDELYWNAAGIRWNVTQNTVKAVVKMPAKVTAITCFAGPERSSNACNFSSKKGATATFTERSLYPYEGMTVVVAVPRGTIVPAPEPILDERWSFDRAFSRTPATLGIGAGLLALVIGGVGLTMWRVGRDRRYVGSAVDVAFGSASGDDERVGLFERPDSPVEFVPPDNLRPGLIGTLIDETANPLDVTATIVDLAVRGYLRIEEIPKEGWFGKPDWRLVKLKDAEGLLEYERSLFNALFSGRTEVTLNSLRRTFADDLHKVQNKLYDDVVARGWFTRRPDTVRAIWFGLGLLLFLVGVGLTVLAAIFTHWGLVPLALAIGGVVLMAGSGRMPRRTAKGTGTLRRVLGFRIFIEESEKERARFAEQQNLFSEYLPYAIVFGCVEKWARAFEGLADEAATSSWYRGNDPFTTIAFAHAIDGFTVTTSGTISAAAPSSSGGSGFSGGFSGGGGGGGGGGSW
jgi:uncharacterized protein (TIGR04222 family)